MTTQTDPNFRYWDSVDPETFLDHDWQNPSRAWATEHAIAAAAQGDGTLLEVGPGPGVDYDRHFRAAVQADRIRYKAYEGSENLCNALRLRFPESSWHWAKISDLEPGIADVVYARHVLEHQPALEPALGLLLAAARKTVVLTWYRPPGPSAFGEIWEGVPCQTYARPEVMARLAAAGFQIVDHQSFPTSGDETWVLQR